MTFSQCELNLSVSHKSTHGDRKVKCHFKNYYFSKPIENGLTLSLVEVLNIVFFLMALLYPPFCRSFCSTEKKRSLHSSKHTLLCYTQDKKGGTWVQLTPIGAKGRLFLGRVLWFEYEMSPWAKVFKYLVSRWWCGFGRFWNL